MYGVLYAISPEIFPANSRGTGNALVSTATRVFGVIVRRQVRYYLHSALIYSQAPVIALYANLATAVPVYISGALIIGAGARLLQDVSQRTNSSSQAAWPSFYLSSRGERHRCKYF